MTEVELVDRLQRELATQERWAEIRQVVTAKQDASLAPNQFLVYPVPPKRRRKSVSVLRVVVEHLSASSSA